MTEDTIQVLKPNKLFSDIKTIPPVLAQKYIPSLDGLRAFSVGLVILSHSVLNFPGSFIRKFDLGGFGVIIFFVISGFLITTLLIKERIFSGRISLKDFYIRRALRILPVVYLYLLVVLILNNIFQLKLQLFNFFWPAFFMENFASHTAFAITGHFWSLSVEEQFYLIFPFILNWSFNGYIKIVVITVLIIPVIIYLYFHTKSGLVNSIFEFFDDVLGDGSSVILLGSIVAILLFKYPHLFTFNFKYIELVQVFLLLISYMFYMIQMPAQLNITFCAITSSLFVISTFCTQKGLIFKILNYKPIMYIGTLSYSLYVWQQMFTYHQPWANSFKYGSLLLFNLPLLAATAALSYHFYEHFFLKLKYRFVHIR